MMNTIATSIYFLSIYVVLRIRGNMKFKVK